MKKMIKALVAVVVVVIVLVVALLAAHPLWVGPLVKAVAEKMGPKYTGTPLALTSCDVNLYNGHVELIGFDLSNPAGCAEKSAASVSTLKVDVDVPSALTDVIVVRSIEASGIFASYVKGASGKYNFTEIGDNAKAATGSSESAVKPEATQPPVAEPKVAQAADKGVADKSVAADKPAKKVIIERLSVSDVKMSMMGLRIPLLPGTIVLTDIGKKSNGATAAEAWEQVRTQILNSSGAAGKQISAILSMGTNLGNKGLEFGNKGMDLGKKGLDAGTEGVNKVLDSAKKLDVEGAKDALKSTGDQLKDVGGGMKDVGKDVGDSIKNVGKGLKGLFGN